jgi:uncharacterized repeat protein (TIGR03803 family)
MSKHSWIMKACIVILLWSTAAAALFAQTMAIGPSTPTFTTLYNFDGTHGGSPTAGLVQGADGGMYGISERGSNEALCNPFGCGTVFKITLEGVLVVLHYFDGIDGYVPSASLTQGTDGEFYGTTELGGEYSQGTVFKITSSGALTTLYDFCALPDCSDGAGPTSPLVQGSDGNFYGTTGGDNVTGGSVFRITSGGTLTTLYNFCPDNTNCKHGSQPYGGLIEASDGRLYGTTFGGGASDLGTVFRITLDGELTTLYSFCPRGNTCHHGTSPEAGLIEGANGNFYGTTSQGGADSNSGTVFEISSGGILTTLHTFCSQHIDRRCVDGADPISALVLAPDGNFYGTTYEGGVHAECEVNNCGTVFKITPDGAFTPLYDFCSESLPACPDGDYPAGLVLDTSGSFYGTTNLGGANDYGTVFSLGVGLGPFVETNPAAGKVGAKVGILGTALTGATGVTFNGTATAFRVVSPTFIEATVPSGATTGTVQVHLPSGTLSSDVPFYVLLH